MMLRKRIVGIVGFDGRSKSWVKDEGFGGAGGGAEAEVQGGGEGERRHLLVRGRKKLGRGGEWE